MRGGTGEKPVQEQENRSPLSTPANPAPHAEATLEKDYAKSTGAWAVAITKTAVTVIVVKHIKGHAHDHI
jgi:hypothetical protein